MNMSKNTVIIFLVFARPNFSIYQRVSIESGINCILICIFCFPHASAINNVIQKPPYQCSVIGFFARSLI